MPAATTEGGEATAEPDVCDVPSESGAEPTTFTNTASLSSAVETAENVLFAKMPVIILSSEVAQTDGDEEGVEGGVSSGTFMESCTFVDGSETVLVEGQTTVVLTSETKQNLSNAVGSVTVTEQEIVLVAFP
jgi:hypothetical protein